MDAARTALKLVGLLGVLLSGTLFALTFLSPETIESSAKAFVVAQVEREVRIKYSALEQSRLADKALGIAAHLGYEKRDIQKQLDAELPQKIANILAALCGYDCEKRKQLAQSIADSYRERMQKIDLAQSTLAQIVKGKYLEIVGQLRADLRIFLGSNLVAFALLLAVVIAKPRAAPHLLAPAALLLVATLVSTTIYIFGQDWFYTILYNDYMGWGYLVYLCLIFGFLLDIVFNRGRVTSAVLNAIGNAVGSALAVVPC